MVYSQLITLDSGDVYNKSNPNVTGTYSDFNVRFDKPIKIEEDCFISLVQASMYYTWPIVSVENQNNAFSITKNGTGTSVMILNDGIYDALTLNDKLFELFKGLIPTIEFQSEMPIIFVPDIPTSKFLIKVKDADYSINLAPDLSIYNFIEWNYVSQFWKLLGWGENQPKIIGNQIVTEIAENIANVNFDITSYFIHIDIIKQSAINNDTSSSAIHQFIPNCATGSVISLQPTAKIYLPCTRQDYIDHIRVWVTDNKQRIIKMQEPIVCTFHITNNLYRQF